MKKPTPHKAPPAEPVGEIVDNDPLGVNDTTDTVEATEPEPIPPAPGDDPESVFDRRLQRLSRIVEDAEFESGSLLGDMVTLVVDLYKHRPALWSAMGQTDQRELIKHVEVTMKDILQKVVLVVAEEDSQTIQATMLAAFTVKGDAIEGKFKIDTANEDIVLDAYRLAGHRVVIISADDKRFRGARKEIPTEPDQRALQFADADTGKESFEPPADDSDLAGDDEDEGGSEEGLFGVFAPDDEVWLEPEGGMWTDTPADAGSWPKAEAETLAAESNAEVKPIPAD